MLEYKYFATTFLWTFFSEKYFFVYIFFQNLGSLNFEKMEEVFGDAWKHLHVSSKEIENATEKVFLNWWWHKVAWRRHYPSPRSIFEHFRTIGFLFWRAKEWIIIVVSWFLLTKEKQNWLDLIMAKKSLLMRLNFVGKFFIFIIALKFADNRYIERWPIL